MKYLCLDLGTTFGWAWVDTVEKRLLSSGSIQIRLPKFASYGTRFIEFAKHIDTLLLQNSCEGVFFEEVRAHRSVDSAHIYGGFAAVLTKSCEERDLAYKGVHVGTIKKVFTGKGNADKNAMMIAAHKLYGVQCKDDNQADAIGVAHYVLSN